MKRHWFVCIGAVVLIASMSWATPISFSQAEGYTNGDIDGQPDAESGWSRTHNNSYGPGNFSVLQGSSTVHPDYLKIELSTEHGSSANPTTVDYATKRMVPASGLFSASFSVRMSLYSGGMGDETCIALGQSADSGWGPYLGMNKLSSTSLAYHDGTEWVEITSDLANQDWLNVEIAGNTNTGLFDIAIYMEDQRVPGEPDSGLIQSTTGLPFRDAPAELSYVMLTNDGSSQDTGGYSHHYDDLYLTPEPATLVFLAIGGIALIRRK